MSAIVNYRQVAFDPTWIDETGFMLGALDLVKSDNEMLVGFQILEESEEPGEPGKVRRRQILRNIRTSSQGTAWGHRPMLFQIGYQKVIQEVRLLLERHGTGKRVPYNARAVLTPHQITVRAADSNWNLIDSPVASQEYWIPYRQSNVPQSSVRWLPLTQLPEEGSPWIPIYEDGFHRACLRIITLLIHNTGIALRQEQGGRKPQRGMQSLFLAIERDHEWCRRDIESQIKRTREAAGASAAKTVYDRLTKAIRPRLTAGHAEGLLEVLKDALHHYYQYCLATGIHLPLDEESPIVVAKP